MFIVFIFDLASLRLACRLTYVDETYVVEIFYVDLVRPNLCGRTIEKRWCRFVYTRYTSNSKIILACSRLTF